MSNVVDFKPRPKGPTKPVPIFICFGARGIVQFERVAAAVNAMSEAIDKGEGFAVFARGAAPPADVEPEHET